MPAAGQPRSTCPTTRWSSASASTASRAGSGVPLAPAREIAAHAGRADPRRPAVRRRRRRHRIVNGLGGTPLIELYVMFNEVATILARHGVEIARSLVGSVHHLARHGRLLGHAAAGRTTSCSRCGTLRCGLRPCAGGSESHGRDGATLAELRTWVRTFAALIEENRDLLTELDAAIGDADHGAEHGPRHVRRVVAARRDPRRPPPAALFKKVGMTLVSHGRRGQRPALRHLLPPRRRRARRGGPAGPPTVRRGAPGRARGRRRARQGGGRGQDHVRRARPGARRARRRARGRPCRGRRRCRPPRAPPTAGRDATTPMLARKGRASYLGERSTGTRTRAPPASRS